LRILEMKGYFATEALEGDADLDEYIPVKT
jgi:hypothetical protein